MSTLLPQSLLCENLSLSEGEGTETHRNHSSTHPSLGGWQKAAHKLWRACFLPTTSTYLDSGPSALSLAASFVTPYVVWYCTYTVVEAITGRAVTAFKFAIVNTQHEWCFQIQWEWLQGTTVPVSTSVSLLTVSTEWVITVHKTTSFVICILVYSTSAPTKTGQQTSSSLAHWAWVRAVV